MFERFTESARKGVVTAQEEARALGDGNITTRHLLLGYLAAGELPEAVTAALNVDVDALRAFADPEVVEPGPPPPGQIPFSKESKKALELSLREALVLGHNYIAPLHVILGLLRDQEKTPAPVVQEQHTTTAQKYFATLALDRHQTQELVREAFSPPRRRARPTAVAEPPIDDEAPSNLTDTTEWQTDAAELSSDLLGRRLLATELARRLVVIDADPGQVGSFIVQIDGPWGAGKTTLTNYLSDTMRRGAGWLVVELNAWRERRIRPAWFSVLARLRAEIRADLGTGVYGLLRRARFRMAEHHHRFRTAGASLVFAVIVVAAGLLAAGVLVASGGASSISSIQGAVAASAALLVLLFGLGAAVGKAFFWDSATSASWFERLAGDPMERVANHVTWLLKWVGDRTGGHRPVLFIVDDLDRCDQEYVVELLEALQNLFRDAGPCEPRKGGTNQPAGPYIVVAADGKWLRKSYETVYADFASVVGGPGQRLGYLFLDKLVQLALEIPELSRRRLENYLSGLLGNANVAEQVAEGEITTADRVRLAETEEEIFSMLAEARKVGGRGEEDAVKAAVEALGDERVEAATRHALQQYVEYLPPNPRAIKRFVNEYGVARAVHTIEGNDVAMGPRAIWTILRLRWPAIAEELRRRPDLLRLAERPKSSPEASHDPDEEVMRLLRSNDVQAVVHAPGGPLTPRAIQEITGRGG